MTRSVVLRGGSVLADGRFENRSVQLSGGRVAMSSHDLGQHSGADIDLDGLFVSPGLIDLQLNGFGGVDLCSEPERMEEVARLMVRFGVTGFLPTVISSAERTVSTALETVGRHLHGPPDGGARILGLHLEGPMLNPLRGGAHPRRHLRAPDLALIGGWSRERGVSLVTLAPELEGAHAVIDQLLARGVAVFAGHTDATSEQLRVALDAGVSGVTHLFNAMPPLHHRAPGPVGVALTDSRVVAGLIADGVHLDPTVVQVIARCLGPQRLLLVSDAVSVAGLAPGDYEQFGRTATSDGQSVRLGDGTLAGSLLTLDQAVRNLVEWTGWPLADALRCASTTPAKVLRRNDLGVIRDGALADLVVLDPSGSVVATIVAGQIVYVAEAHSDRFRPAFPM
jgi:N-acetylglucosamine-6-phosphate deacetylase